MATSSKSSSSYGGFADGVIIRGMPLLTLYPGNDYWVDSNAGRNSNQKGTFANPCTTLLAAHTLVTSDNGDIICLKPGHAETYTATVDFSKSGFAIIGLGYGFNRPTFTNGITASGDDAFDFAGDDVVIYNIKWKEGAPAGDTVVIFNVSGSFVHIENCYLQMGGKTLSVLTHDTTAQTDLHFINNTIIGTAAGPDKGIMFEKKHSQCVISGNKWLMGAAAGMDTGIIIFSSGAGQDNLCDGDTVIGLADSNVYLTQTVTTNQGLCMNLKIMGDDATDHLGATPATGWGFIDCLITEGGKGVPAIADHAGARPQNTTPQA